MGKPAKENQPARPPMVSQPSDAYEKAQEDEREVLKAIFMEDFEEAEAKGAWSVCCSTLVLGVVVPFLPYRLMTHHSLNTPGLEALTSSRKPRIESCV